MFIQTINPATGAVLKDYALVSGQKIDQQLQAGHQAWLDWQRLSLADRKQVIGQLIPLMKSQKSSYAALMAMEMGKPIAAGEAEIDKCIFLVEHYLAACEAYLADELIPIGMRKSKVVYRPMGLIFAIMPWNFPFWQVFRFLIPNLLAGNGAVLKHAPICSGTGELIVDLLQQAGLPAKVFQHLVLDNEGAARVIAHPAIAGVTLTGSEAAGQAVARSAGEQLKKTVLELGGNDPYLILSDADLDLAAQEIVLSRLNNCGQVCIAAKRVLAVADIYEELQAKIQRLMQPYQPADPLLPTTLIGPMARADLRQKLDQQVKKTLAMGAQCVLGGEIIPGPGYYYQPALLGGVKPGMPAFDEELFGPVISLCRVQDEAEAIQLANQSQYGLGAAVFTQDLDRGERIATESLAAGSCFVNQRVFSDPRLPFGGIKHSGFGRELARQGMLAFMNTKTVVVK